MAIEKNADVLAASQDLRRRTLVHTHGSLDRLIYLASMRDYNTGRYVHEGLAARFSCEAASEALAACHREAFQELTLLELKDLVAQLEAYMQVTGSSPRDFLHTWRDLEPYRVAVPVGTQALIAEFLSSNFKIALAVLQHQLSHAPAPIPAS